MLRTRLSEALKVAMKARDKRATSTLRLILAALKDRDIAARGRGKSEGVGEDEILDLLQKMVRQRHDSIEMYQKGNREDLVEKEKGEIEVIERFLPKQLTEEETKAAVEEVIGEQEASSIKDMGRVMGELKKSFTGRMDFGKASGLVKARLS
ncbi:MAG: GatB/YqeY domain-containing protein [Alphaproteobacteria bacterium]